MDRQADIIQVIDAGDEVYVKQLAEMFHDADPDYLHQRCSEYFEDPDKVFSDASKSKANDFLYILIMPNYNY